MHESRSSNKEAHNLARLVLGMPPGRHVWFISPPDQYMMTIELWDNFIGTLQQRGETCRNAFRVVGADAPTALPNVKKFKINFLLILQDILC